MPAATLTWTMIVLAMAVEHSKADETELIKLYSPHPKSGGHFGGGVMSGDRVLASESNANAVYAYRREANGWVYEATLAPHDPENNIDFGAPAIDGDVAVIGSPFWGGNSRGAAYVFRRVGTAWSEEAMLLASDGAAWDYFGSSVAVNGNVAIVVAGENAGKRVGAAYVFRRGSGGWVEEAKLIGSKAQLYDGFGVGLDLEGDVAVMGTPYAYTSHGNWSGCAYVFRYDGTAWHEEALLIPSTGNELSYFGFSARLHGETLIAGAPYDSTPTQWAGAAFVFDHQGGSWVETAKIQSLDPKVADNFGWSVALDGERAAIGEYADMYAQGSVSVFERAAGTWSRTHKLVASDGEPADYLGSSVDLWGDDLVAAASNDSDAKPNAGALYFYCKLIPGVPWLDRGHATPGTNGAPVLQGQGDLQPGQPVTMQLTSARADSSMVLVIGDTNFEQPIHGIVLGPYPKFLLLGFRTDASGATTLSGRWPDGVPSCYAFYFQAVIMDPLGPDGLAASNILSTTTR
ncbi:MAG: hypothetical protein U1E76_18920 [Planctomycetota bacterium]